MTKREKQNRGRFRDMLSFKPRVFLRKDMSYFIFKFTVSEIIFSEIVT